MSTLLIAGSPGSYLDNLTVQTGGALQTSNLVELQISQSATAVNDNGTTRPLNKEELIILLNLFSQQILRMNYPFAAS